MVMSDPRATLPEDAEFVSHADGHERGYWGIAPDQEDNSVYTVAGVTGGTDKADSPPSKAAATRSRANTAALKKESDK
jgi:hypothetical protein